VSATYHGREAAEPSQRRVPRQQTSKTVSRSKVRIGARATTTNATARKRTPSGDGRPNFGRMALLLVGLVVVAFVLTIRLADIQVAQHPELADAANAAISPQAAQSINRGIIYDDANNPIALDDDQYYADAAPNQIFHPRYEARKLAPVLQLKYRPLERVLARHRVLYARLAGPYSRGQLGPIQRVLDNPYILGITLDPSPSRVYPDGMLGSQVLGFDGANGGQYGLEQFYNSLLSGAASRQTLERLAHRQHDGLRSDSSTAADDALSNGATLKTSLDLQVQGTVEQYLRAEIRSTGAVGGMAIVMNPKTGRVIAMAGYPTYNPNDPAASPPGNWSNPAITYTYEPGSTFKVLTMSAGIDEHVITPKTTLSDPGWASYLNGALIVHNWNCPAGGPCVSNGTESMIQVLQHSANVGAAFVANLLGDKKFYKYVTRFGIGQKTGIDLQGEAPGYLPLPNQPHSPWSPANLYTNAYGQAVSMTPLQLLDAVNAVANGGCLMQPEVVTQISYKGLTLTRSPRCRRHVMSVQSARTVTHMLVTSAIDGEASEALIPGYHIAAKTGTASIAAPDGGYLNGPGSTIASTVAYAPAYHPRFSVLVVVRQPQTIPWGSEVAAPVVSEILQSLFLRYHIQPH
jgi:cell division protein FtsI/penicillin-binding protein 2